MTRAEVLQHFPLPLDYYADSSDDVRNAFIWYYGLFELHFEGDRLWLIFCDHLTDIFDENSITFDKWIFTKKKSYTLKAITHLLISEQMAFSLSYGDLGSIHLLIEKSKVKWGFYNDEYEKYEKVDWKKWKLANLCLEDTSILAQNNTE